MSLYPSLYPSLEDMQVSRLIETQNAASTQLNNSFLTNTQPQCAPSAPVPSAPVPSAPIEYVPVATAPMPTQQHNLNSPMYPGLENFLGLELTPEMIRLNMPEYCRDANSSANQQQVVPALQNPIVSVHNTVAPLSGNVLMSGRAHITHNIREFVLCKGGDGKVGLRVQSANNGVFVCIVVKGSPAAMAGIRFGDQILQLNGVNVAGYSVDKIHKMLKQSGKNNISVVIRDRPFERTITLMKDSKGNLGFQFKSGKIVSIVKDSSAARNGVLTDHQILEVNGQSVVAMKDKDIRNIIDTAGEVVKINIVPAIIYDQMVKKLSTSYLRGIMDHSIPDF